MGTPAKPTAPPSYADILASYNYKGNDPNQIYANTINAAAHAADLKKVYDEDLADWNKRYGTPTYSVGSSSSSASGQSISGNNAVLPTLTPPTRPDTSRLEMLADEVQRKAAIKTAVASYDRLAAATRASGFQAASNAGTTYGNRLIQAGVNPLASGVVAAQSKMKVFDSLADIEKEKETTRLDAVNKSQALSAQIASVLSNINLAYSKNLSDFNLSNAQLQLDLGKFQASNSLENRKQDFVESQAQNAATQAALAAATSKKKQIGATPYINDFDPGYITSFGPVRPSRYGINQMPDSTPEVISGFDSGFGVPVQRA